MNVFISHAEKDRTYATSLGKALTGAGLHVWEPRGVQPGDNWALKAGEALAEAAANVVAEMIGHRADIVTDQHSAVLRRHIQDSLVMESIEGNVLGTLEVYFRVAPNDA